MAITFRTKSENVEKRFEALKSELEDRTNNQTYGNNATLNMAINMAYEKLQEDEEELERINDDRKKLEDSKKSYTDFLR